MSLSTTQRAKVRRYLGFPDGNCELSSSLEGAMTSLSAEGEVEVVAVLTQLATIETSLESSWARQKVIRAEEVTLAGADEIMALRAEGNRLASTLASILGVEPRRQAFTSGASGGIAGRG